MSFSKLNKIISLLPPSHVLIHYIPNKFNDKQISTILNLSREAGAYNALTAEKLGKDPLNFIPINGVSEPPIVIESAIITNPVNAKKIIKKKRTLFQHLGALMEILSPWMVTFVFFKTIVDMLKKRQSKLT